MIILGSACLFHDVESIPGTSVGNATREKSPFLAFVQVEPRIGTRYPNPTYQDCGTGDGVGEQEYRKRYVAFEWHDHFGIEWSQELETINYVWSSRWLRTACFPVRRSVAGGLRYTGMFRGIPSSVHQS